jgi:hypothetical protein
MLRQIEHAVDLVKRVQERYAQTEGDIHAIRRESRYHVAEINNVNTRTVMAACTVQLRPEIRNVNDFDQLLVAWVKDKSPQLCNVLLKHCKDIYDIETVLDCFDSEVASLDASEAGPDSSSIAGNPTSSKVYIETRGVRVHGTIERNSGIVRDAKAAWKKSYPKGIPCEVCTFIFRKKYGVAGEWYIEAHHRIPLSQLTPNTPLLIEDLAPVCANCHRIIHSRTPWLSLESLKAQLIK